MGLSQKEIDIANRNALAKEIGTGTIIGLVSGAVSYYIVTWFYSAIYMIVRGENISLADQGMVFEFPHTLYVVLICSGLFALVVFTTNNLGIADRTKKYIYIFYFAFLIVRLLFGVI